MLRYVNHACHPHPLTLWEGTCTSFRCALCRCRGYGSFYRCPECKCDYEIHDTCGACPESLTFFGHPQHPLVLDPVINEGNGRRCDLCLHRIHGIQYYGCRACGFFLHPVCATLPTPAISPIHRQHFLTLVPGHGTSSWRCESCDKRCAGWHYACAPCAVRLHPWCLLGGGDKDYENFPLCILLGPVS